MAARSKKKAKAIPRKATLPIADLLEMRNPANPRKPMDGTMFMALRSLHRKYGSVQPAVVNTRSGNIVGGHQRIRAAAAEGFKDYPVRYVSLDPTEEKELTIGLNNVGGEWDDALLTSHLEEIKAEFGGLDATGFDDLEFAALLETTYDSPLAEPDTAPTNDVSVREMFGGDTSLTRASAPWLHWSAEGLVKGDVLDFGCGQEDNGVARYDPFTHPDAAPLVAKWDTIVCSYVLNTQPSDHLIVQILALLSHMLKPKGALLLAVVAESKSMDGTRAAGGRKTKTRDQWEALVRPMFKVKRSAASGFYGWVCKPKAAR